MNMCLEGFKESVFYRKNLKGFITLDNRDLTDSEVRLIVNRGIKEGYKDLYDIPDEVAEKWLEENKQ